MFAEPRNVIAMTGDHNYLYPLAVAIHSLATAVSQPVHLDFAIPGDWEKVLFQKDLDFLRGLVMSVGWEFEIVEVPLTAEGLPRTRHISSMTFMKPAYLDVSTRRQVAFLDGDLIATRDWSALLNTMPNTTTLEATHETNMHAFEQKWMPSLPPNWYFNAGVFKARPELWQTRYTDRWRQLLSEFDSHQFNFLEQDIMNATLLGRTDLLPPELNCRPAYGDNPASGAILHFAGWWKPWLTVPMEVKGLSPSLQESYRLYLHAEQQLVSHVNQELGAKFNQKLMEMKLSIRGTASWRAHRRYIRWALAKPVRQGRKYLQLLKGRILEGTWDREAS